MKKQSYLKKAMRISVIEGIYAQLYATLTAIGSNFITKAAVVLNASPIHFSLLSGIAQLCQLFQLYAVVHNRKVTSRKKPCVWFAFWGRLLSALLGFCFVIINPTLAFFAFFTILLISASLLTISSNMWTAWMSDLIPKSMRGRFFSQRMQIHMICGFLIGYIFSFFIDLFEAIPGTWRYNLIESLNLDFVFKPSNLPIGLSFVFIIGTALGLYGLRLLQKQPERQIFPINQSTDFSIFEPLKNKDFRRLLTFGMWWMFAVGVGAPFWGPFMISTLNMSLVEMQIYSMLQAVGMLISFRFWGKFIDKFGNKTAMKICVFLGTLNPLVWVFFTENNYSLIWVEGVTSGIMWSGANLIAFNFVLAISPRGKEQHWSAIYASCGSFMMLTSILLSGILFPPKVVMGNIVLLPEQVLFALTGILRLSAEIPLHYVNEQKSVPLMKMLLKRQTK